METVHDIDGRIPGAGQHEIDSNSQSLVSPLTSKERADEEEREG